jgi:CO/xanthine dehydrogenase FAD-binding subunit
MGTVGGNLLLDTRCNYYDQTYEWRKAIDFCMKKDGKICWVAPSSPRCWAVQSSDLAPVMVALGASVTLMGPKGSRTIPAAALYRNDGIDFLTKQADELLTHIEVPPLQSARADYQKLRRRGAFDFPVLGVAAWVDLDPQGLVRGTRIVVVRLDPGRWKRGGGEGPDQSAAHGGVNYRSGHCCRQESQAARQHRLHDWLAEGHGAGLRARGAPSAS